MPAGSRPASQAVSSLGGDHSDLDRLSGRRRGRRRAGLLPGIVTAPAEHEHECSGERDRDRAEAKPDKSARKTPDLRHRDFTPPEQPNIAWVGDPI
jgi:hypothetical protein